jgi:hypothetical protein
MGLPKIKYRNESEGVVNVIEAQKGIALLILQDETKTDQVYEYLSFADVLSGDWTGDNYTLIQYVYDPPIFNPTKLIVIRIKTTEKFSEAKTIIEDNNLNFNWGCFPKADTTDNTAIISYIESKREDETELQFWKWIVHSPGTVIDKEFIVNFTTVGIEVNNIVVTSGDFLPKILGLRCGVPYTQSLIVHAVQFPEVTKFTKATDEDLAIDNGEMILVKRRGLTRIGDDVNSFVTFTPDKDERFSSNSIMDRVDFINESEVLTWEKRWRGAVTTSYDNKLAISQSFTSFLMEQEIAGLLEATFDNRTEIDLEQHRLIAISLGIDPSTLSEQGLRNIDTGNKVFLKNIVRMPGVAKDLEFITRLTTVSNS